LEGTQNKGTRPPVKGQKKSSNEETATNPKKLEKGRWKIKRRTGEKLGALVRWASGMKGNNRRAAAQKKRGCV